MTEKFFNILPYDVIPVVYNGANMSRIAPPHSYINVQDFPSIKDLSDYLKKVHRNDTLFASYFWWRDYYTSKVGQSDSVHTWSPIDVVFWFVDQAFWKSSWSLYIYALWGYVQDINILRSFFDRMIIIMMGWGRLGVIYASCSTTQETAQKWSTFQQSLTRPNSAETPQSLIKCRHCAILVPNPVVMPLPLSSLEINYVWILSLSLVFSFQ